MNATWDYVFEDLGDGTTRVTSEVVYDIPATIVEKIVNNKLLDRINQHTLEQMLDNLKLILESEE